MTTERPSKRSRRKVRGPRSSTIEDVWVYLAALDKQESQTNPSTSLSSRLVTASYRDELRHADAQERRWRTRYYTARAVILGASAAITIIGGLSVPSGSPRGWRIAVLALGGLITVVAGLTDLFHILNRWRIYRVLRYRLLTGGLTVSADDQAQTLAALTSILGFALREFEDNYITQIATEGSPPKEPISSQKGRLDPAGVGAAEPTNDPNEPQ